MRINVFVTKMDHNKRKKSFIWKYFLEINPGRAKCEICSGIYSFKAGTTSNLTRHLKTKHPTAVFRPEGTRFDIEDEVESVTEERTPLPSTSAVVPSTSASVLSTSTQESSQPPTKRQRTGQSKISEFVSRPLPVSKSKFLDGILLKLIVKQFHPFRIVEQAEFRELIHNLNPNYVLPSRKTLSNALLDSTYNRVKDKIKANMSQAVACSITTDSWTSAASENYVAITVHYLDENSKLCSALLDCFVFNERHTAENISHEIRRVCQEWEIDNKIVAIVTDNAANMVAAARNLGWQNIPCFAHTLNLIVQNALGEIRELQVKVKTAVEYFKRSPHALSKLKEVQKQMGLPEQTLKQEVQTRWNSTLTMFESLVKSREAVVATLAIMNPAITISREDFEILEEICKILKPFLLITEDVSSEKQVTISKLILFSRCLKKYFDKYVIANKPKQILSVVGKIKEELERRFKDIEDRTMLAEATLLDPRFKKQAFLSTNSYNKAKQSVIQKAAALRISSDDEPTEREGQQQSGDTEEDSFWDEFDSSVQRSTSQPTPLASTIIQFDKYIEVQPLGRKADPFKWWQEHKIYYPRLYQLMLRRLCIVGSSVPCERVFSRAGNTLTELRRRLTSRKLRKIMFLNYNL